MDRHEARALEILSAIDEGRPLSQRALAERLGIGLGPVAVYAAAPAGDFLGFKVLPLDQLDAATLDGVVVATFERPETHVLDLQRRGVPRAKCVTLRRLLTEQPA